MENYITWSELINLLIAIATWAGVVVAIIAIIVHHHDNKKK